MTGSQSSNVTMVGPGWVNISTCPTAATNQTYFASTQAKEKESADFLKALYQKRKEDATPAPATRNPHLTWTPQEYHRLRECCKRANFERVVRDVICLAARTDFPMTFEDLKEFWQTPENFPYLHVVILRIAVAGYMRGTGDRFHDAAALDVANRREAARTAELTAAMAKVSVSGDVKIDEHAEWIRSMKASMAKTSSDVKMG